MRAKQFKILFSKFRDFENPKEKLEQYATPSDSIYNLLELIKKNAIYESLINKLISKGEIYLLDACAGTFKLSLSFLLDFIYFFNENFLNNSLNYKLKNKKGFEIIIKLVEIDEEAIKVGKENIKLFFELLEYLEINLEKININIVFEIFNENFLNTNLNTIFDIALINPPFGLKQRNKDLYFIKKALNMSLYLLSIHNGPTKNKLLKEFDDYLIDYIESEFPIKKLFWYHNKKQFNLKVIILLLKNSKLNKS